MKTIALNNFGCSKNIVDGEIIASYLSSCGFKIINEFDTAEIIVINTCTFIQEATEEAINAIAEMAQLKTEGACKTLVISGCFSERYRNMIKNQFPEVDLWVGLKTWPQELNRYFKTKGRVSYRRKLSEPLATQYLKISDGCSHRCSYCIIPSIRGPFKSRTVESIVQEATWLCEQGVKECILVSQDTSFFGHDTGYSLAKLLEILIEKTDFHWIRMMYLHPSYIDKSLLTVIASEKRICSYLDIPLQHIAEPILKKMKRVPCSSRDLYGLIERIRTLVPDVTIRTAFILGFPGETNSHLLQLLKFIEWARFEKVGLFPFSPEEGTKACNMKPLPRTSTALKRCEIVMDLQKEISREICESHRGSYKEIIIDRISGNPDYPFECRTRGDAPEVDGRVFLLNGKFSEGNFVNARITDANDYDLYAKV